jgi:hypothetical protein
MRRTAFVIGLVVASIIGATSAAAGTGHRDTEIRSTATALTTRGWLSEERAALARAGARGFFQAPAVRGGATLGRLASLLSVGDLRGNGHRDVLELRQTVLAGGAFALGLTARDGRKGTALWARRFTEPANDGIAVLPATLGAGGEPGFLAVDLVVGPDGSGGRLEALRLRALSGASGKLLWTHTFNGIRAADGDESNLPLFDGVLTESGSRGSNFLVASQTTMGIDLTSIVYIVSGATGSPAQLGGSYTSSVAFPTFAALPDLDRDGVGDVLVLLPGGGGFVRAISSGTGNSIWTIDDGLISEIGQISVLPHFSSATTPDLAILVPNQPPPGSQVVVLKGSTGATLWRRAADGVMVIDRAGHNKVPAVGIDTVVTGDNGTSTAVAFDYQAVSPANKVVYRHRVSVSVHDPIGSPAAESGVAVQPIGDVQPDGALETQLRLEVSSATSKTTNARSISGIIDGRTGHFRALAPQTAADGSLRHGSGTDLLTTGISKHRPRVAARRGSSGTLYYQRVIAGVGAATGAQVSGLRVTGHSCSDLSLATAVGTRLRLGILTARGAPLWLISFSTKTASGGTLAHFAAPKAFCI